MSAVRTDYHIHTTLCHHAVGDPIEYVQAARSAGLTEIGFADHNPMPEQFDAWRDYGLSIGFQMVFSGPLVRSSYMADLVSEQASR